MNKKEKITFILNERNINKNTNFYNYVLKEYEKMSESELNIEIDFIKHFGSAPDTIIHKGGK